MTIQLIDEVDLIVERIYSEANAVYHDHQKSRDELVIEKLTQELRKQPTLLQISKCRSLDGKELITTFCTIEPFTSER